MSIFDEENNRRNSNSYKWDVKNTELPMWVADMDFKTAPAVVQALRERVDHEIFGYNTVPNEFNEAIQKWWKKRHDCSIEKDWIMFCTGIVPAISSIVRKLTRVGDNVVVLSPVYNIFYNSIVNNYRTILPSFLKYQAGEYEIDFLDLEEKLANENTSMMIFCNPHNPIGKIWDKETLVKIDQLCVKYDVILLSDEIHCDIVAPGKKYTPFISISDSVSSNLITCLSPTKAFNLAGIQTSAIVIPNEKIRKLVNRGINTDEVAEPNSFAIQAAIAAFENGADWLEELNEYLFENRKVIESFFEEKLPMIKVIKGEATYLAWLDCSKITKNTSTLCQFIQSKTGLIVSSGEIFGINGKSFIRMNFATSRSRVMDGLDRMEKGINSFILEEQ